jgi:hypothetical protein
MLSHVSSGIAMQMASGIIALVQGRWHGFSLVEGGQTFYKMKMRRKKF